MLPLIVSIISIFVVVGVSTTIYVQAANQRDLYNKRLAEVVGKTNSANQYEFEKNKDQEVSLERVRGDVVKTDGQIAGITKNLESVKAEYGGKIADMSTNLTNVNRQVTKTLGDIQAVSERQSDAIAVFKDTLGKTTGEVKVLSDKMAIVNGKLVNIGEKQQTAIDGLLADTNSMKTEQGNLRDYIYSSQSQTASAITSQNETIADYQSTTTGRLAKQDEEITKAFNVAKSVQNIVTTLDTAIENVRMKFNDYVSKTDILGYATKNDLNAVNNTFDSYVHSSDFTAFKNSLPAMYTAQEMNALTQNFVTNDDIAAFQSTLGSLQTLMNEVKTITDSLSYTYATKQDIVSLQGGVAQETMNIGSLQIVLSQLQGALEQVKTDVTAVTTNFNTFKTSVESGYALKSYVTSEISKLESSLSSLKTATEMTLGILTVSNKFTATGDINLNGVAVSKTYTGFPNSDNSKSEIVNDSTSEKKLLLVGNKSAGTGKREVGVWDNLTVGGNVSTTSGKVSAADLEGTASLMIGANGSKGYFKSDGSGFVSGNFGVGVAPTDAAFNNGTVTGTKQMIVRGGSASDWQAQFINPNGNRSIYLNHGTGNGMQINTNDNTADKYALQTTNSASGKSFEVMNDGSINTYGGITLKKHDPGPFIQTQYNVATTDNRYGIGQFQNGAMRLYGAGGHSPATVNLGFANLNGAFNDVVSVSTDSATKMKGNLTVDGIVKAGKDVNVTGKIRANVADTDAYPTGWMGGVMAFDVYSAGGSVAAGDTAGNVKASINRDGDILAKRNLTVEGNTNLSGTTVNGKMNVYSGGRHAVPSNYMANGSLTIGSTDASFGGGTNWNNNTAGLLLETADNTEIAVHDAATRLASLMYYDGPSNKVTVGRDMGWGAISKVDLNGDAKVSGDTKVTGKLRANIADSAAYPSGWVGGVMTTDVYSAGGSVAAGDAAGNLKAGLNRDGVVYATDKVSSDNVLCIKDVCVNYNDLKRLSIKYKGIFGKPLFLWEGYDPIWSNSPIRSRMTYVGNVTELNWHLDAPWWDRYMIGFGDLNRTFSLPTTYVRFKMPIDPTTHNMIFVNTITNDRYTCVNMSICDPNTLAPVKKIGTRTNNNRGTEETLNTSFIGPSSEIATVSYHEWLGFCVPKELITTYKNSQNEINIALSIGHTGADIDSSIWLAGLASCPNPYGITNIGALDMHYATNGGNFVNWSTHNWHREALAEVVKSTEYSNIRIPIASTENDLIVVFIERGDTMYGGSPRIFVPSHSSTEYWKLSPLIIGNYGNSIKGRGTYRNPMGFLLPKAVVAAGAKRDHHGALQLQITINNKNCSAPFLFRGVYTEIAD